MSINPLCYHEEFILEVAIATLEQGGTTSNLRTHHFLGPIDSWGLPRYPERTLVLPPGADIIAGLRRFIHANAGHLQAPGAWLGTWINPLTHCCHLDITEIFPTLEEARAQALCYNSSRSQAVVAIYHFQQKKTVYVIEEMAEEAHLSR